VAIEVRRGHWSLRGPGWVWTCSDHPRHRGYHADQTRAQVYYNKKNVLHPWVRCINGAVEHYHKFHVPAHNCCLLKPTTS
jgi:hypothetical protein